MTDWTADVADYSAELGRRGGARAPATLTEIMASEWTRAGLDTITGIGKPWSESYRELLDGIERAAGTDVGSYSRMQGKPFGLAVGNDERVRLLGELVDSLPDEEARKQLEPLKDVRRRAAEKAQKIERDAADVAGASYGLSGAATAFLAGTARQMADPLNLAANVATAPIGGPFKGPLLAVIARQAASGAAAQLAVEPFIQAGRGELGLEHGFAEGAINVAQAGLGAGGLAGLFKVGAYGLHAARHGLRGAEIRAPGLVERPAAEPPPVEPARAPEAPSIKESPATSALMPEDLEAAAHLAARDEVIDRATHPPLQPPEHAARVDAAAASIEKAEPIVAWHGSPHRFEQFDMSRIGSGEGAQAYGHGIYFAESPATAGSYRLAGHDASLAEILAHTNLTAAGGDVARAIEMLRSSASSADAEAIKVLEKGLPGALYKVRILAEKEHFLDWDKPLSEQSAYVRERLRGLGADSETGSQFYQKLTPGQSSMGFEVKGFGPEAASAALRELGIPGIKYLDQGSRPNTGFALESLKGALQKAEASGDATEAAALRKEIAAQERPTQNFVLFDDSMVRIVERNEKPLTPLADLPLPESAKVPAPAAAAEPADITKHVTGKKRGRAGADPDTWSLVEFIAARGGIKADDPLIGDVKGSIGKANRFVPGFGQLIRKNGLPLDRLREAAVEAGYIFDAGRVTGGQSETAVRTLLDAIDTEMRGQKVYKAGAETASKADVAHAQERNQAAVEREIDAQWAAVDLKPAEIAPELRARVVEIMHKEGEADAVNALERAIMEAEESHDRAAAIRREEVPDIPGWDVAHEPGAAPGGGGAAAPGERPGAAPAGEGARPGGAGAREPGQAGGGGVEATPAGAQRLIPGVEPISQKQRLEAQAAKPLRGGEAGPGAGGLFDEGARKQTDLLDTIGADPALKREADRVLAEAGGDFEIVNPDGTKVSARHALLEAEEQARAAAELTDCIGLELAP